MSIKYADRKTYDVAYWQKYYGGMETYKKMSCHRDIVDFLYRNYDLVGKRILDVGGGPGVHAELIQREKSAQCAVIDGSRYALSYASPDLHLIEQDFTDIPWRILDVENFDFIYSIQALEHLDAADMPDVLRGAWRWLVPGGEFFLSVAQPENTKDETHLSLYPLGWWIGVCLAAGFESDAPKERIVSRDPLPKNLGWNWLCLRRPTK